MQVVKKWEIVVWDDINAPSRIKLFIHDDFLSNVLRKLSDITFDFEPQQIRIELTK